jgi:anti-sigma regulatory factor (Ser/Thr protein kinase)
MIAVTTYSRAKGFRHALAMMLAGNRIERELEDAPGCERFANVIAGPRDFWTLTIWRDASALCTCMREGTHAKVMWQRPSWLDCYWGMRWRPGGYGSGEWEGDPWQWPDLAVPDPSLPEQSGVPTSPETGTEMPSWMQAALGKTVPLEQRKLGGAVGATYRLRVRPWSMLSALRDLRRLRRIASADRHSFKLSLGLGTGGALYLLVIATSPDALERLRARPEHQRFLQRWGDSTWWSTWEPESEFGHWDSHRLREGLLASEPLFVDARLPIQPVAAFEARKALRDCLHMLDQGSLDLLQLLTSELVTNNLKHAGLTQTDWIGLQVRAKRDWIRVDVIDHGRRFEPRVPVSKSSEDPSGWGLFIVNQKADRWGIIDRQGARHVWFEVRVPITDW